MNLERTCFLLFYYFLYFKVNLDLEKTNQLGESSPNFIFAVVNFDPIIFEKRWIDGESWPNDFVEKVNRSEDLRWVGSRCLLTRGLMQPSMGTLNSPSSTIVKDSTPSRRRILGCLNFGNGESSSNLFLNMVNFYKIWSKVNLERPGVLLRHHLFYLKSESWPWKNKFAWWIFTQLFFFAAVNLEPIVIEKKVNWWRILT